VYYNYQATITCFCFQPQAQFAEDMIVDVADEVCPKIC